MDYFYKTVEAAQKRAQTLSQQASESAKGFAEQVSTHTKTLAEQAANASSIAAEQAGQKWKELKIQDTLPLGAFDVARQGSSDAGVVFDMHTPLVGKLILSVHLYVRCL